MSETTHSFLVKVIGLGHFVGALYALARAIGSGWGKLFWFPLAFLALATGAGIWQFRRWAWLVAVVGMLAVCAVCFTSLVVALAGGQGPESRALLVLLVAVAAALGYFGRHEVEKRFGPHLDAEHAR